LSENRLEQRRSLLSLVDHQYREKVQLAEHSSMDNFSQQALKMVLEPRVREAFDLTKESEKTKEAYGRNSFGQSLLLARRLVEAGSRFVTAAGHQLNSWDTHSDNDQRHRLVIAASVNSPMTSATTPWERISHGFQASTMVQYYSSLPFNVVSGINSLQGTAGRPSADGSVSTPNFDVRQVEFIPRNAGTGSDFFTVSLRLSRSFQLAGGSRVEGLVEAFNLTDRVNPITRNNTFGPGSYPSNPLPSFNTVTAVGDPRSMQFGVRLTF